MLKSLSRRFWEKVDKNGAGGCWLWTGRLHREGYGVLDVKARTTRAHRISWAMHVGTIPGGLLVLHKCDVRACCNPSHLFLGTHTDNHRDMTEKGRVAQGERHYNANLAEKQVVSIIARLKSGEGQASIARDFDVKANAIDKIKHGHSWKKVPR